MSSFEELVAEATGTAFEGWDFSFLDGRFELDPLPWTYDELTTSRAADARSLLDLGTGGGELVASMSYRPPLTVATEGWMPNVPLAARTLRPLGVGVVAVEGARDNVEWTPDTEDGRLPFADGSFDVVIDRHEAFNPREVARIMRPGAVFVTQQVGSENEVELNAAINGAPTPRSPSLDEYVAQLERSGLVVTRAEESHPGKRYLDVGAVLYNLLAIPWQVPGFDLDVHRGELEAIHRTIESDGSFNVTHHRLLLEARRP